LARASVSTRPSAAHLRALLPQCGIRDRLQRLVQGPELMRDTGEALGVIEPPVEHVDLVDELVEALEHSVELAVFEGLAFGHAPDSTPS
jgi:hypothetical protein